MLQRASSIIILIFISPLLLVIYLLVKYSSQGPFLFIQKRAGISRKSFNMYKIRTMFQNAELEKSNLYHMNEADGPVFKIYNDPRYTPIGKFLSHTGLDELPQLINIIKGDMEFIGPRPLPVNEARQIPKRYDLRFSILPGITSPWVVNGAHKVSFKEWMDLDIEYVKKKSIKYDVRIAFQTINLMLKNIIMLPFMKK